MGKHGLCKLTLELGLHPIHLAHSRLSLSDVAQDCGFFDQPHLSRSFRARFGVTPGDYRSRAG